MTGKNMAEKRQPVLPASGLFVHSIRSSSRRLREASNIQIHSDAIRRLLFSPAFTMTFKRVSRANGLVFPLKFVSPLDELNFLSVLSLVNFASGYRAQLHAAVGRGAWDTMRALVLSMYLTSTEGDLLSADGIRCIDRVKIAELMGVDIHVEAPHTTIPGLTIGKLGGPMYELVGLVTQTLNETGEILLQLGYPNLGAFVAEALQQGEKVGATSNPDAALSVVLERLVRAFPAFQDMAEINGEPIYCFKKALFLIHTVAIRFGSVSSSPFPIPSTTHSPIFVDNVLPSMLIHLGVIDLSGSPTLSSLFPNAGSDDALKLLLDTFDEASAGSQPGRQGALKEGPILTVNQSYLLRAAAIDACDLMVDAARRVPLPEDKSLDWMREIAVPELDMWLWAVAKDRRDYRMLERFALKDTVFF